MNSPENMQFWQIAQPLIILLDPMKAVAGKFKSDSHRLDIGIATAPSQIGHLNCNCSIRVFMELHLVPAALFLLFTRRQLCVCGGWVITAMLSRISSTSRVCRRQSRTCLFQIKRPYRKPSNALRPSCLQIINAKNGDQLQGQRPVLPP